MAAQKGEPMTEVSGNLYGMADAARFEELQAAASEPLHPDLVPYVEEEGPMGEPVLRHPLVYDMFMTLPGLLNQQYRRKRELLDEAQDRGDWHSVVFLHERPYRLEALIETVTGRADSTWEILPLGPDTPQDTLDLVADVWVDSENIQQNIEDWQALINNGAGYWLGSEEERAAFDALPTIPHKDGPRIHAWRGGAVGDWSWTTDEKIAQFFSRRSGYPVRGHQLPVADVFGYLTRRGESELLVRYNEFRAPLVYPVSGNEER